MPLPKPAATYDDFFHFSYHQVSEIRKYGFWIANMEDSRAQSELTFCEIMMCKFMTNDVRSNYLNAIWVNTEFINTYDEGNEAISLTREGMHNELEEIVFLIMDGPQQSVPTLIFTLQQNTDSFSRMHENAFKPAFAGAYRR